LIGAKDPAKGFAMPQGGGAPVEIAGFSSFITTRASAYVFLPSINAMRFISGLDDGR
jgi:hypothetical protein